MRVFFDHQSSTPLLPEAAQAMASFMNRHFAAPSSLHLEGHQTREALDQAREVFAHFLGAESPENIIFTGNGTESVNLAIKGTAWANARRGNHIITSAIEHPATLNSIAFLEARGFECTRVPADATGRIDPAQIARAVRPGTILIAVHHANHDIGTLQPVEAIGEIAAEHGIPLFVDAIASAGVLPLDAQRMNASLVAISPHRFQGPKGVGVLYRNRRARLESLIHGGSQEDGRRAGSENVPAIIAAAVAAEIAGRERSARYDLLGRLQRRLWEGISMRVPGVLLNGAPPGERRLPNNLNLSFEHLEGEGLALALDMKGFAVAAGAACVTKTLRIPPVLAAIGVPESFARGTLLISFGKDNTLEEVERFLEVVPRVASNLREMSPLWNERNPAAASQIVQ